MVRADESEESGRKSSSFEYEYGRRADDDQRSGGLDGVSSLSSYSELFQMDDAAAPAEPPSPQSIEEIPGETRYREVVMRTAEAPKPSSRPKSMEEIPDGIGFGVRPRRVDEEMGDKEEPIWRIESKGKFN